MIKLSAVDMKVEFLVLFDRAASQSAPGFENEEISQFLNYAQERLLKLRLRSVSNRNQEAFEQTEKRRKDFSELTRGPVDTSGNLVTSISANQNGALPNGVFFDLPEDFLWAISERIETDITCDGTAKVIKIKPVTHDQYNANVENPFKQPDESQAWRMDFSEVTTGSGIKRHEIITDGSYLPTKYLLRYLKTPREIDIDGAIDCELDKSIHREIVSKAVEIALETIMDPRFQSKKVDNVEIE